MKRPKNYAYIAYLLIMILLAVSASGCGKEPSPSANTEAVPSEELQATENAATQVEPDASAEDAAKEAVEENTKSAEVHSATDGLIITNNEMYDSKRKVPVYDTLYATLKDVEIWGEGELDIDVQPEGTILRQFIVKPVFIKFDDFHGM